MLLDGVIGGATAAMGTPNKNAKNLMSMGVQSVKRPVNKLKNKGVKAAVQEVGKAFSWYASSTSKYYKGFFKDARKDFIYQSINSGVVSAIERIFSYD